MNLLKALKYVSVDLFIVTLSLHNDREKNQRSSKQVSQQCAVVMPLSLVLSITYGPHLSRSSVLYYFYSSTLGDWPIHDQCGTNNANQ